MDGVLARANCLLITTLWSVFKFILVPIGARLAAVYSREEFAVVFALIWGSYSSPTRWRRWAARCSAGSGSACGASATSTASRSAARCPGFAGALVFCLWMVIGHGLPAPWIGLAVVIAVSNSLLELFSPRGTDDFTMATANALICLGVRSHGPLVRGPLSGGVAVQACWVEDGVNRAGLCAGLQPSCLRLGPGRTTDYGPRTGEPRRM